MYSFHSSLEEKNKLLSTLAQHGIETTVNRVEKKQRIREWIQSSVIAEEDEVFEHRLQRRLVLNITDIIGLQEEHSGTTTPSSTNSRTPVPGHISAVRAQEQLAANNGTSKRITTTVKDSTAKHRDPRTGLIQQGPSEMGATGTDENRSMARSTSPPERRASEANDNHSNHDEPVSNNRSFPSSYSRTANNASIVDSGYGSLDALKVAADAAAASIAPDGAPKTYQSVYQSRSVATGSKTLYYSPVASRRMTKTTPNPGTSHAGAAAATTKDTAYDRAVMVNAKNN